MAFSYSCLFQPQITTDALHQRIRHNCPWCSFLTLSAFLSEKKVSFLPRSYTDACALFFSPPVLFISLLFTQDI